MSDRTYNPLHHRIWSEPWTLAELLTMVYSISSNPNSYGVYKVGWGLLERWMMEPDPGKQDRPRFSREEIRAAIKSLNDDGAIRLYRSDTVIWVRNLLAFQPTANPKNPNHIINLRKLLDLYPEVELDFLNYYDSFRLPIQSPSNHHSRVIESLSNGDSISDTDTDTDTESEKNNIIPKRTVKYVTGTLSDLDLAQLEAKCRWLPSWEDWKQARITASDAGKVTETGLASDLRKLLARQDAYGLDNQAMAQGIELAIQRGAMNTNYIVKVAQGYSPLKGLSNSAYYGEDKRPPLPPVQPGPDDIVIGESNE